MKSFSAPPREEAPPHRLERIDPGDRSGLPRLSFVVPVKSEESTLVPLFEQIDQHATPVSSSLEVVFVDDGSEDDSWRVIAELARENPEVVRGLRMRRNVGKARALEVAFRTVTGDVVFTMDADLQDDPRDVPAFLRELERGYDLVSGWKRVRRDPWHKVIPSRIFNWTIGKTLGVKLHDHNCGFKCYRREVIEDLRLYGEMHRMIPALAGIQGYRTGEVAVRHHPRVFGASKYGFARFWRGFMDMLTLYYLGNFRERPAHLMGANALLLFATGVVALGQGVVSGPSGGSRPLLFALVPILMVGGIVLFNLGLLAAHLVHESLSKDWKAPVAEDTGQGAKALAREGVERSAASV